MMNQINIYQTSPNQKIVVTQKTASDKKHLFGVFNINATLSAAQKLTDRAFKLYVRMNLHQDKHTYALSPAEIGTNTGMSNKRYRDAVNELIAKGYLVQNKGHRNMYTFLEHPEVDGTNIQPVQTADRPKTDGSEVLFGRITTSNSPGDHYATAREIITNSTYNTFNTTLHNTSDTTWFELPDDDVALPF